MTNSDLTLRVANCPEGSCTVYARNAQREETWLMMRYMPATGSYLMATVDSGGPFLQFYESIDNHYYLNKVATVDNSFKQWFFETMYTHREAEDDKLYGLMEFKCVSMKQEYEYATAFIKLAESHIFAADRLDPETWSDPNMLSYIEGHKVSPIKNKKRVHVFDVHALTETMSVTKKAAYEHYIACQEEMNVELVFRDSATAPGARADGFLIIDDKVLLSTKVERPMREEGSIYFRDDVIRDYIQRFDRLTSTALPHPVLSVMDFRAKYLT